MSISLAPKVLYPARSIGQLFLFEASSSKFSAGSCSLANTYFTTDITCMIDRIGEVYPNHAMV